MRFKLVESLDEEALSFSDWLDQNYGMGPNELSNYDRWFIKYLKDYYINTEEGRDYSIKTLKAYGELDEAFEDDDFESSEQEFSSADTSINSSKLPAVFKKVKFNPGTINLDYGGGRFDNATEFLADQDVENLIFDKFNRSDDHNKNVIKRIRQNGGADTATCSNVLNVIKERDIRVNEVIKNIKSMLKPGGTAYFTVYEGTGLGDSKETTKGYQLNKKTADYVEEIEEIFGKGNVVRKGSVIIAKK